MRADIGYDSDAMPQSLASRRLNGPTRPATWAARRPGLGRSWPGAGRTCEYYVENFKRPTSGGLSLPASLEFVR